MAQRPHLYKWAEIQDILSRRYPAPPHLEIPRHKGAIAMALYALLRIRRLCKR